MVKTYEVERSIPDYFLEHKKYFEPRVVQIQNFPVWSMITLDNWASNSILIEGDDGLVLYDTGTSREHGERIYEAIREISDKPIVAIFYSHHHPDHYNGADSIVSIDDVESGRVRVIAWDNFEEGLAAEFGATGPSQAVRLGYHSGSLLPAEDNHHTGCCGVKFSGGAGYIPPNETLSEDSDLVIAGVRIRVFYTGGEAESEFGLYLPDYKIAMIADEIFHSFPNLYTLRGAKFRDAEGYMRAAQAVLDLGDVEHLLGSHLVPLSGRDEIFERVTKFRDGVQWIHDQSLRYINKGYTMPELKQKFTEVPDYLDNGSLSAMMYGHVQHIAPQMYAGYVGQFNGDPIELSPTPPVDYAQRLVDLMGGRDSVFEAAEAAFNDGDPQFAAELTTYLIRTDQEDWDARNLKAAACRTIGYLTTNTTWRAWYLTSAMELEGSLDLADVAAAWHGFVFPDPANLSLKDIFKFTRYRVNAEEARDRHIVLSYDISDTGEQLTLELRNSVLISHDGLSESPDVTLQMNRGVLNQVAAGELTYDQAIQDGSAKAIGDPAAATAFWELIDNDVFADRIALR